MAYPNGRINSVSGNVIQIENPSPLTTATTLSANQIATDTALTVRDNNGFINKDLLLIGNIGEDQTEIKQVNAVVTAGTALTSTALTFPHNTDTIVSKYLFDQVEILGASTAAGNKTSIATTNLLVDSPYTSYVVTGTTYNFYFVRYYNSQATVPYYGDYSAAVASTDYVFGTVKPAIDEAFLMIGEKPSDFFTLQNAYAEINNCYLEVMKERKKWSWRLAQNYILGQMSTGTWSAALPSNIEDKNSNKSIFGSHLGKLSDLEYVDKEEWDRITTDVAVSTLAQPFGTITGTITNASPSATAVAWSSLVIVSGGVTYTINNGNTTNTYIWLDSAVSSTVLQTSNTIPAASSTIPFIMKNVSGTASVGLRLTSSVDFDDTGSITVEADSPGYTTSNDRTNGVLWGIQTGSVASAHASGVNVFTGATLGQPVYYTVINQTIYIYPVVGSDYNNRNLYLDYVKGVTVVSSDTDDLLVPDYMLVAYYIAYKILLRKNNGIENDGTKAMKGNFRERLNNLKTTERNGQFVTLQPRSSIWINYRYIKGYKIIGS